MYSFIELLVLRLLLSPQWGPIELICLSQRPFGRLRRFLGIICAAH